MTISEKLAQLDLSVKESSTYLALLSMGRATVLDLSKKSKIERSGLYYTLKQLQQRGMVKPTMIGKTSYWEAVSPSNLLNQERDRYQVLKSAIPELMALSNQIGEKPQVKYFQGIEGVIQGYEEIIDIAATYPEADKVIYQYGNMTDIMQKAGIRNIRSISKQRVEKGVKSKLISYKSEVTDKFSPFDEKELRETVYLKDDPGAIRNATILVFGDYIAFANVDKKDNPSMIMIKQAGLAAMQRQMYQAFWDTLS